MKTNVVKLLALFSFCTFTLSLIFLNGKPPTASGQPGSTGLGSVETLRSNYEVWKAEYIKDGGDRSARHSIGWFRGLSTESTDAHGQIVLDFVGGDVSVEAYGLSSREGWDLWLVDNKPGSSVMPELDDTLLYVGRLKQEGDSAKLEAHLGAEAFANFKPDLFVVTHAGRTPLDDRVLVGITTLFHRLYYGERTGDSEVLAGVATPDRAASRRSFLQRVSEAISPTASAQIGPIPHPTTPLEALVTEGRRVFLHEKFDGNGRTCNTCHREENNFTIDPEFIATLPSDDPLFVAEFDPNLSQNFENPVLMRKLGLILENTEGFDDLPNKFVMRSVPHLLALLPNTLKPSRTDASRVPPLERTGWGGDGAPGSGTLREFAIGAIVQHFPKTLGRVPGEDFRLPTDLELDALEAFQRSLGRRADLDLNRMTFKSEVAESGKRMFNNIGHFPGIGFGRFNDPPEVVAAANQGAGKCLICHFAAGAGDFITARLFREPFPTTNSSFDTGVENLPSQPAILTGQNTPRDGGGFDQGRFNSPVVVESADTGPYFHNNSVSTLEGAVAFYNDKAFNNSPIGKLIPNGIHLESTEVSAIAAFLRVVNALENIRSATDLAQRAKAADKNTQQAWELLKLALAETNDALDVLQAGGLHPEVRAKLRSVGDRFKEGIDGPSSHVQRSRAIGTALSLLQEARSDLVID